MCVGTSLSNLTEDMVHSEWLICALPAAATRRILKELHELLKCNLLC